MNTRSIFAIHDHLDSQEVPVTRVTLADATAHLSASVDQAVRGETIQITRRGKPVAEIAAIGAAREPIDLGALQTLTGSMPPQAVPARAWLRQQRDEARY